MVGLKPTYGGSIPPFLGIAVVLEQMQVLQMCGREGDIHEVTPRLL